MKGGRGNKNKHAIQPVKTETKPKIDIPEVADTEFKASGVKFHLRIVRNNALKCVQGLIQFKTTELKLLRKLLYNYCKEQVYTMSINKGTVFNAYVGYSGIMLIVNDTKFYRTVADILQKVLAFGKYKGNYNKLHADIINNGVLLIANGRTDSVFKEVVKHNESKSAKIAIIGSIIDKRKKDGVNGTKEIPELETMKVVSLNSAKRQLEFTSQSKLYLSIAVNVNNPWWIEKDSIMSYNIGPIQSLIKSSANENAVKNWCKLYNPTKNEKQYEIVVDMFALLRNFSPDYGELDIKECNMFFKNICIPKDINYAKKPK